MNPTNLNAPNDIAQLSMTDFRPSKALYVNVKNNNQFRLYMQRNANAIRQKQLDAFEGKLSSRCEKQLGTITKFDDTYYKRSK